MNIYLLDSSLLLLHLQLDLGERWQSLACVAFLKLQSILVEVKTIDMTSQLYHYSRINKLNFLKVVKHYSISHSLELLG